MIGARASARDPGRSAAAVRCSGDAALLRQAVLDILQRIAPDLAAGALDPAAPLRDQVDLDSLDWLNFLVALSERLGVAIPEADYGKVATLDELLAYLGRRHASALPRRADRIRTHRLDGGTVATLRPIRPDDARRVRDFLRASSEESRYRRFQKWIRSPTNRLVHFLIGVDDRRSLALVATVPTERGEEIVAEARCLGSPDGTSCELGLLVADAWQKTGIAGLLMEALIEAARERGFQTMEGEVLADNAPMLRFAHALDFAVERTADLKVLRIRRRLQGAPEPVGAA